jgi:hypothetical protein
LQIFRPFCLAAVLVAAAFAPHAQASAAAGDRIDAITCDTTEGVLFHIHQHLAIFDHGKPVPIPGDVGRPGGGHCLYWIHTHTPDGLIHIEAPVFRTFTLANFFDIWGQPLSATAAGPARCKAGELRVFADGVRSTGNPRHIEMNERTDIVIQVGPPYSKPVPFTNWQGQ